MKKKNPSQPIALIVNGHTVGHLNGHLFTKRVSASVHKFRAIGENGSWGIDYKVLHDQLPDVCAIEVHDKETGNIYKTTKAVYKEKGVVRHFKEGSIDHYTQVFLPLEHFDVIH